MDTVAIVCAKYLLYVMVAGFGLWWLLAERRRGKAELAASAAVGLAVVLLLLVTLAALYWNDRPFVVDPSITPLLPHAPDNGFPSNHAAAAGLIAVLIALRHRGWGVLFAVAAALVAWGRVAVRVHHLLDVTAGLAVGAVGAGIGTLLVVWLFSRTTLLTTGPLARWIAADPRPVPDRGR